MGLDTDDLDKLSQDVFTERRIGYSVYCSQCGYNLRSLPYTGRCTECGSEYNARPAVRKGIYISTEVWFPFVESASAVFFLGWAAVLVIGGSRPVVPWMLTFGFLFLVTGVISVYLLYCRLRQYLHFRWVTRHVEDDD